MSHDAAYWHVPATATVSRFSTLDGAVGDVYIRPGRHSPVDAYSPLRRPTLPAPPPLPMSPTSGPMSPFSPRHAARTPQPISHTRTMSLPPPPLAGSHQPDPYQMDISPAPRPQLLSDRRPPHRSATPGPNPHDAYGRSRVSTPTVTSDSTSPVSPGAISQRPSPPLSLTAAAGPQPPVPRLMQVPQEVYRTNRSRPDFEAQERIEFRVEGSRRPGIPLREVASRDCRRLVGGRIYVKGTYLRILWPGYPGWSRKMQFGSMHINTLATRICSQFEFFLNEQIVHPTDERWSLGPGGITFDKLILVAIENVSAGSWQPEIHVEMPDR